ncbi:MAG TPA: transglycosylase SLT domain-containing protein [Dokdonella sp.]|uniref:transglycosylase SLT domain-containing protein n=1 Tax=Dokdonella sp. TaxID=2291710 RepID=UPI0025C61311|nr:transglycosylase SLT domain-containing protein [Dokdonella sp.]MBX3690955.1 transglycosylase SLT domain-containing protein [Dokdonella sp.]HNR92515.1 transglycosylase SLT domain-containing protein [Dokdonella sp.]
MICIRLATSFVVALVAVVSPAQAADREQQRSQYRRALEAVARESGDAWKRHAIDLADYPLLPYVELGVLERGKTPPSTTAVEAFLARWPDSLVARNLREKTLRRLANAGDWATFRRLWQDSGSLELKCAWQRARIDAGEKPDYAQDIAALWMQPRATPALCEPLFAWARTSGGLTDAEVWARIEAAAAAANPETVAMIGTRLDAPGKAAADRVAATVRDPASVLANAAAWPDTPRNRDALSFGFMRLARRDSATAETRWAALGAKFQWDPAQKYRILNAIAVYRSTGYEDDALARLKALPIEAADDASREWHVRVALATGDWNETLAALEAMSEAQRADARWRYLRARMLDKLGRKDEAGALFAEVAREANFHGFLAADWIGADYSICADVFAADRNTEKRLLAQPDLARAFEFHALGQLDNARREWDFAMTKLEPADRRLAADIAYRKDWYDRAVFLLSASPTTQRHYEQRFPLAMKPHVTREARSAGIDPAWSYAIIRAESAWMTDARSHADAYGLMQLLPSVAKEVAQRAQLPYHKPGDLFDPAYNVQLGTRFLAQMAGQYSGSPWLASAAYNAGSAPVKRWLAARGGLEPDFFIETIPYKETREYVARVLAFSVIYDWRLNASVVPLAARLPKIGQPYQSPKHDAQRKRVSCAVADRLP